MILFINHSGIGMKNTVKYRQSPWQTRPESPGSGCTGALVTGLTSAAGGNMVGQTQDQSIAFWPNTKVELVIPQEGYRYFTTGDMYGPMAVLNEKGIANTEFYRGARVIPYPGPDSPRYITGGELMRRSDSTKKYVELWSENVTRYGSDVPNGAWARLITDSREGYLLEVANWVYNDPANHAIHGPMTDQVFAHANFYVSQRLKPFEVGIGAGYSRAKRMWQLLIDRQYDSCMSLSSGISLSYLMSCFRDHGDLSPEGSRYSILGVPEERNKLSICTHGLKGYSAYSCICVSREIHPDLFSCLWTTFGQPCLSPFLPFYMGINSVPEDMRTSAAARVFEDLRLAIEYHPEYRDKITHYWKIFDIHTIEESTALEGKVTLLADGGKVDEARKLLTEFVVNKCDQVMKVASQMLNDVKDLQLLLP
jgi:hypothetical protein